MITFLTLLLGIAVGVHTIEVQVGPGRRVRGVPARRPDAPVPSRSPRGRCTSTSAAPFRTSSSRSRATRAEPSWAAPSSSSTSRDRTPKRLSRSCPARAAAAASRASRSRAPSPRGPRAVELSFDGQTLDPGNLARIRLPDFRSADVHVLRAVLEFKGGSRVSAELLVGGVKREAPGGPETMRGEAEAELTAVPVVFKGRPPKESEMDGWFLANGEPVHVEAVEESPGEIVVVKDENAGPWIAQLRTALFFAHDAEYTAPLRKGQRLRFCWPGILKPDGHGPGLRRFPALAGLRRARRCAPAPRSASRRPNTADRRASATPSAWPRSPPPPGTARAPSSSSWPGPTTRARRPSRGRAATCARCASRSSSGPRTEDGRPRVGQGGGRLSDASDVPSAVKRLTKAVEAQRIVWLEGRHLPQSISLSPRARKVTLVE